VYQLTRNVSIVKVEHNLHVSVQVLLQLPLEEGGIRQSSIRNCKECKFAERLTCCHNNNEQPPSPSHQRPQQQTKVIDVYGRETEPICSYRKCHHKFSVHGHDNHNCKCRHAMNYATGISILPLTKIEVL
jgi:hypothetical protein